MKAHMVIREYRTKTYEPKREEDPETLTIEITLECAYGIDAEAFLRSNRGKLCIVDIVSAEMGLDLK